MAYFAIRFVNMADTSLTAFFGSYQGLLAGFLIARHKLSILSRAM